MNTKLKDQIPSNAASISSDNLDGLHMKRAENNVNDEELGSTLLADEAISQGFSWSLAKVTILASLCVITALSFGALSMIVPFFPREAKSRGVSTSVVGLIFATYPLMVFIFAPICGLMIAKYGPHKVLFLGMLSGGTSLILFGFCAWIYGTTEFVVLSFLLRALSAFGGAASETSVMSIVIGNFPERLGMASGFIATFVGVGLSSGPVFGGGLYTVGGFQLPFFVTGCSMIAAIPVLFCLLSREHGSPSKENPDNGGSFFPIVEVLTIPAALMVAICYTTAGLSQMYFGPILAPHLEQVMNLNAAQIGLMFLVIDGIYGLVTPLAGWIGDKTQCYGWLAVAGFIGAGFGSFLLGPAPFLTSFLPTRKVWFACVALVVIGFSWAAYFVQLMPNLVGIMRDKGMPDNSATRGVVTSIFSGMYNLGATIGPTLAGIIDQRVGFQWAMTVAGIISFAQAVVLMLFTLLEETEARRRKNPYSPIVASEVSDGEE